MPRHCGACTTVARDAARAFGSPAMACGARWQQDRMPAQSACRNERRLLHAIILSLVVGFRGSASRNTASYPGAGGKKNQGIAHRQIVVHDMHGAVILHGGPIRGATPGTRNTLPSRPPDHSGTCHPDRRRPDGGTRTPDPIRWGRPATTGQSNFQSQFSKSAGASSIGTDTLGTGTLGTGTLRATSRNKAPLCVTRLHRRRPVNRH